MSMYNRKSLIKCSSFSISPQNGVSEELLWSFLFLMLTGNSLHPYTKSDENISKFLYVDGIWILLTLKRLFWKIDKRKLCYLLHKTDRHSCRKKSRICYLRCLSMIIFGYSGICLNSLYHLDMTQLARISRSLTFELISRVEVQCRGSFPGEEATGLFGQNDNYVYIHCYRCCDLCLCV